MNLARVRKAIVAALGMGAALIAVVPEEMVPEQWRVPVAFVLWLATVAGVYQIRNAPAVRSRADLANLAAPTRAATEEERPRRRPPFEAP